MRRPERFFFPQAKIDLWSLLAQLREGDVYFFRRFLIRYKPFLSISSLWLFSNAIFFFFFCNWWLQSDFMNITYVCKSCVCLNLFLLYFPSFPFFALLFLSGRQWEPGFYLFCVLDPMSVFFTKTRPVSWHGKHDLMIKVAVDKCNRRREHIAAEGLYLSSSHIRLKPFLKKMHFQSFPFSASFKCFAGNLIAQLRLHSLTICWNWQ